MHVAHTAAAENVQRALARLVRSSQLAHLWIFSSPSSELASAVARAFLLDWLQAPGAAHPDLQQLKASGKVGLHPIDSIHHMIGELMLTPFSGRGRAVLIEDAERMAPATANTLLKILEEPPPRTVIALATAALHKILPTILSRAQVIRIPSPKPSVDYQLLDPVVRLFERGECQVYPSLRSVCESIVESVEKEEASLVKTLQYQDQGEADGDVTIWRQLRAKAILEKVHLFLREIGRSDAKILLKALESIDCGLELESVLLWYLSTIDGAGEDLRAEV